MKTEYSYGSYESNYRKYVPEVIKYIEGLNYGSTIGNITLAEMLHYDIDDDNEFRKFKYTMYRIRTSLFDRGIVLVSIRNVGYYILKPGQVSSHCYRTYVQSSRRLLGKSKYILDHIDSSGMSNDRLEEYQNFLNLNEQLIDEMSKTIESSKYYNRKSYYDNLNDNKK